MRTYITMCVNVFVRVCVSLHEISLSLSLSLSLFVCVRARACVCFFACMIFMHSVCWVYVRVCVCFFAWMMFMLCVCVCVCDSLKLCGLSITNITSYLPHRCYVSEIVSSFTLSAVSDLTEGHSRHQRRLTYRYIIELFFTIGTLGTRTLSNKRIKPGMIGPVLGECNWLE